MVVEEGVREQTTVEGRGSGNSGWREGVGDRRRLREGFGTDGRGGRGSSSDSRQDDFRAK